MSLPHQAEAEALVKRAEREIDPADRKKLLDEAAALCPDALMPQEALLFLGRLWQRSPKRLDYHLIKCHLLRIFDRPEEDTPEMREAMLAELTSDPQLLRCMALSGDPDAFVRHYLLRLCREYIAIFLKGDNQRTGKFFGFQLTPLEKELAAPVARMKKRMEQAQLSTPFDCLPGCLMEAFTMEVGATTWVEAAYERLSE